MDFSELPPAKGKGLASSQDWDSRILLLHVQQIENPRHLIPDFPHLGTMLCLICNCQGLPSTVYGSRTHGVHGGNGQVCEEIPMAELGHIRSELSPRDGNQARPCVVKSGSRNFFCSAFGNGETVGRGLVYVLPFSGPYIGFVWGYPKEGPSYAALYIYQHYADMPKFQLSKRLFVPVVQVSAQVHHT